MPAVDSDSVDEAPEHKPEQDEREATEINVDVTRRFALRLDVVLVVVFSVVHVYFRESFSCRSRTLKTRSGACSSSQKIRTRLLPPVKVEPLISLPGVRDKAARIRS